MNYPLTRVLYKGQRRLLINLPGETWPEMLGDDEDLSDPYFLDLVKAAEPEFIQRIEELIKLWDSVDQATNNWLEKAYRSVDQKNREGNT